MVKNRLFANGGNILHNIMCWTHLIKHSFIIGLDPQNIELDTLNAELSAL